jgi:hypothetical protein
MNIVDRVKSILVSPAQEWQVVKNENLRIADIFLQYAVILAAIPAVAGFIGLTLIGATGFGVTYRQPVVNGLVWAILSYILSLGGVYLIGLVIDWLAPTFGVKKDPVAACKVAVFSSTANWVAGIFQLIPMLSILSLAGLYSLFLLWVGLKTVKEVPSEKMPGYYVAVLVASVVIFVIIAAVVGAVALHHVGRTTVIVP